MQLNYVIEKCFLSVKCQGIVSEFHSQYSVDTLTSEVNNQYKYMSYVLFEWPQNGK